MTDTAYLLNDIYPCVQGEGCQAGLAMVLLRLHGCGVGCPWCDTKETWTTQPPNFRPTIPEALGANALYTSASGDAIAEYIYQNIAGPRWILLTGGEPADQDLTDLIASLHDRGYKVAIETSGTALGAAGAGADWLCVSPKIDMPGGRSVLPFVCNQADEIKFVVGKAADLDKLGDLLGRCRLKDNAQICLQPLSQHEGATRLCIQTVQQKGWRLSVQMHKYLRLP